MTEKGNTITLLVRARFSYETQLLKIVNTHTHTHTHQPWDCRKH